MSDALPIVIEVAGLVIAVFAFVFAFAMMLATISNIDKGMQNVEKSLDRILEEIFREEGK